MVQVFNFDNCEKLPKFYGGKSCSKICIDVGGTNFMVKFPRRMQVLGFDEVKSLSYANTAICEYLGSYIFKMMGVKSHETLLGYRNGKLSVGCMDFLDEEDELIEFSKFMISDEQVYKDSEGKMSVGYSMDLNVVLSVIKGNDILKNNPNIEDYFWNMFIIDAFIGNMDRTGDDWGIIFNGKTGLRLAPVYDNDNCLNSDWSVEALNNCMSDEESMMMEAYKGKTCKYTLDGEEVNPYDIILCGRYDGCNRALLRLFPSMNINAVLELMKEVPRPSDIYLDFHKKLLKLRYDVVFKPAYESIVKVMKK